MLRLSTECSLSTAVRLSESKPQLRSLIFLSLFARETVVHQLIPFKYYTLNEIVTYIPIVRQRFGKHVPAGANARLLLGNGAVNTHRQQYRLFSVWSAPRGYKRTQPEDATDRPSHPCGGRVEYLHRDPAGRRRRRKGKSQI
jgi:hypothetical protein